MSSFTKRHEMLNAVKNSAFKPTNQVKSLYLRKKLLLEDKQGNLSLNMDVKTKEDVYASLLVEKPLTTSELCLLVGESKRKTYNSLMSIRSNNQGVFDYKGGVWTLLFPKEDLYFYEKEASLADDILAFIKEISENKVKMVEIELKVGKAQSDVEESKARFKSLLEASDLI